jgi:hypothetical protein
MAKHSHMREGSKLWFVGQMMKDLESSMAFEDFDVNEFQEKDIQWEVILVERGDDV